MGGAAGGATAARQQNIILSYGCRWQNSNCAILVFNCMGKMGYLLRM